MKKEKRRKIFFLILFSIIFLLFLKNSFDYLDPDFGWHLKAGENIFINKEVSTENIYNYTIRNSEWINHEWLADLTTFLIYNNFGYITLSLFFAIISTLSVFLLFKLTKTINKQNLHPILFFLLIITSFFIISPNAGVRIQSIGYLNIIILLTLVFSYERKKNKKILFFYPILFLFWANIHASFLFGFCVLFLYLFLEIIKNSFLIKFLPFLKKEKKLTKKEIKIYLLFFVSSILITLINPFGIKLYSFLFEYKNTAYLKYIQEWLPIFYPQINFFLLFYIGLFFSLLIINKDILFKNKNIKIFWWILTFITLLMSIKSKRNAYIFLISSFPLVHSLLKETLKEKEKEILKEKINKYFYTNFIKTILFIVMLLTIFNITLQTKFCKNPFAFYKNSCPLEAINYIKNNDELKNLTLFNEYGWGGCLIWNWPKKEIFIDGKMPQTKYEDRTIIEEYMNFKEKDKIEEKIEKHNIEIFLIKNPKTKLDKKEKETTEEKKHKINFFLKTNEEKDINEIYPYNFLNSSKDWKKIFENKESLIYIKNN
ncbi:hypothetical protein EOL94_03220 [bacterium]|nr:hypothetical protein [bacterium]